MNPRSRRGAPREGAPRNAAILAGCGIENSEITGKIQSSLATEWLARRAGLTIATARAVAAANSWGGVNG